MLVDQRGAGRSTPAAELSGNTTPALVADLEALRGHLGIGQWLLFGGSWGSTLALAYGEAHPERCLGMVLRGVFLARPQEIDWFMHGMGSFFPEAARAFREALPPDERGDLLGNYYRRLTDPDPQVHLPAAQAWDRYEGACSTLLPQPDPIAQFDSDTSALAIARIEAHYFVHRAFLDDDQLLRAVDRVRHLPCAIVQGRYDVICPPVDRRRAGTRLARGGLRGGARRRPFGARTRHHPGTAARRRADEGPRPSALTVAGRRACPVALSPGIPRPGS